MATGDLTPQDKGNGKYQGEPGEHVRGNTGDPKLDAHTETHDSVVLPGGVRASKDQSAKSEGDGKGESEGK